MAVRNAQLIKIRLQCERAEKEDIQREDLLSQGLSRKEIEQTIQNSRIAKYRPTTTDVNPWDESSKVAKAFGTTSLGLADTHLIKTSTQAMYAPVQRKFDKYNTRKEFAKTGQLVVNGTQSLRSQSIQLEDPRKKEKKLAQREQDRMVKEQNFRDHLSEMYKGMDSLNGMPKVSHAHEQFEFNKNMQELCDKQNFDHHLLKNDLKWFSEAYCKYKHTMRK